MFQAILWQFIPHSKDLINYQELREVHQIKYKFLILINIYNFLFLQKADIFELKLEKYIK